MSLGCASRSSVARMAGAALFALSAGFPSTGRAEPGATEREVSSFVSPSPALLPPGAAWRQAESLAATIPGGDVLVGRGDSMEPLYPDRTVIVVQRMAIDALRAGMTVVFVGDRGVPVAHRLVARTPRGWLAKGVANSYHDRTLVRAENYLGTVVSAFVPTAIAEEGSVSATAPFAYRPAAIETNSPPMARLSGI